MFKEETEKETMKLSAVIILLTCALCFSLQANPVISGPEKVQGAAFAIIIDKDTYSACRQAVGIYSEAVEADGLSTFIVSDKWRDPDQVRKAIIELRNEHPTLEGIVLVGDIPVAMIRQADHLSSSFKYENSSDQYFDSSIPSDRFYDTFSLKFKYISQDKAHNRCFYYSLSADSPQKIERDIYSGRIKATGKTALQHEKIDTFLRRAAAEKQKQNNLDNMLVFSGDRYYSESLSAWGDEQLSLREEVPELFRVGGKLKKLNHTMNPAMKEVLLSEIQKPELDMAIFHAHGDNDMQSINDLQAAGSIDENIESIKYSLRKEVREEKKRHKPVAEKIKELISEYNVPEEWFEGAFDDSVRMTDSLMEANLVLSGSDIEKISPRARVIMLDNCYNGAFHTDSYLAGDYIFGNGSTIAVLANTTTTLQDQWAEEFIGMLGYGARIGEWHKMNNFLEAHLFGDPTFRFKSKDSQLSNIMSVPAGNLTFWNKILLSQAPALRASAINKIFSLKHADFEDELVNIYNSDESFVVRLEALKCLAEIHSPKFRAILKSSITDPFEFIRRMTAMWMGKTGDKEYMPLLARQLLTDESERVVFTVRKAISFIDPAAAIQACKQAAESMPEIVDRESRLEMVKGSIEHSNEYLNRDVIPSMEKTTKKVKQKVREIQSLRIYNYIQAVPQLLQLAKSPKEDLAVRVATIEALGWYNLAKDSALIISTCREIINEDSNPQMLRDEALKTLKRIQDGSNNPLAA
ncbi:MAG: HEAT repeat domain-containing protein [Methanococcaceae archaeon]